jgi:hypothetical protein
MMALAAKAIDDARAHLEREDYLKAWTEARRAGRSLRHLMRGHWERAQEALNKVTVFEDVPANPRDNAATKDKKGPKVAPLRVPATASAASAAFNTIPQHYRLTDWLEDKSFGQNLVPSGSFDDAKALDEAHWEPESYEYEGITGKAFVTGTVAYQDKGRALHLHVVPTDKKEGVDGLPAFLDFPAAAIRSPEIPVTAEYLYRISVLAKCPLGAEYGGGGVIIRDSIGGEALQFRTKDKITDWTRVVLYRRAPEDGVLTVTLGLAAYGDVYFDDFRVEVVEERPRAVAPDVAGGPRRRASEPASATRPTATDRTNR